MVVINLDGQESPPTMFDYIPPPTVTSVTGKLEATGLVARTVRLSSVQVPEPMSRSDTIWTNS